MIVVTLGSSWTVRLWTDTPERSRLSMPTRALVSVRVRDSTLAPPRDSPRLSLRTEAPERSEPELDIVPEPPDEPGLLALELELMPEPEPPDEPEPEPPLEVWA
ncbi:MAG TPA: hypothetical protein VF601_17095 [Beijerinckiaceae bacterium]